VRELLTTPLGIAFLAGLLAAVLAWRRHRRGYRTGTPFALLLGAWAVVMAAAAPPVAWLAESSLARLGERWPPPVPSDGLPPQAILVFGGGLDGSGAGAPLSDSSRERLLAALAAARRWPDASLVFSGGPGRAGRPGVGQRMADEAAVLGLEPGRIVVEAQARTTRDNARFGAAEARAHGWSRLALVTSAVHLARSRACLAREGFLAIPAASPLGDPGRWDAADLVPSAAALARTTGAAHEAIGLGYYALRGWLAGAPPPAVRAPVSGAAPRSSPR
jgi:uncharacterized SAM-binding protein YcdF (DUF218 family)